MWYRTTTSSVLYAMSLISLILALYFVFLRLSDVDCFIEHLENTIKFFTGLQNQSEGEDDDFVPFI